ncbi:M24 family metallopeptidase [Aspergillus fijiensis CBS 313.89]|uniref:Creatinase/aminopeptidase n=1 Tax=Aspergillus fijiensis CBS 313.89 TaxID=1448319 RepID=A0A8G1W205_9EURO|nr:Creatinase/aminopeptidase [Aspergillus fijiensis CBS 313.89]RAK80208.1 Creatinase/aminopeptidase [Aspergillus fijiensis CBS 313.89]
MTTPEETHRATSLQEAQDQALTLFAAIEPLIVPGITEKALSDSIHRLGVEHHNVRTHWHKRLVRSGPNTLRPFADNPPDRTLLADDILVIDLGPVFEEWEADFGRTYVLGTDPAKLALRDALEGIWVAVKEEFDRRPEITGAELYAIAEQKVKEAGEREGWGWVFGAEIAGHIVGSFPHERIPNDRISLYITPGNGERMRGKGKGGWERHWILEIHVHDKERGFGGFCERLLTVG